MRRYALFPAMKLLLDSMLNELFKERRENTQLVHNMLNRPLQHRREKAVPPTQKTLNACAP